MSHHSFVPKSFVANFHSLNVLVKSFHLFITNCFWEIIINGNVGRMHETCFSPGSLRISIWRPPSFQLCCNSMSIKTSLICGPTQIPSFNFVALTFGNSLERYWNPCEFTLPIALTKFFFKPILMWRGG